jgi:endonuclease III
MKNAATYEKKIKVLLRKAKHVQSAEAPTGDEATAVLVESILEAETTDQFARPAIESIRREYVDLNELRVSPTKDLVDCIGRDLPLARPKAQAVKTVLGRIYDHAYQTTIDYMADMPKKDLRRHLEEIGLDPYAAACVVLKVFGGHAVPVDQMLVDALKIAGYVDPDSDREDVQGFLTRIVSQKDALSAHQQLRGFVAQSAKAVAKMRKAQADAQAKVEAEAQAKADAQAAVVRAKEAKKAAAVKEKAKKAKDAKKAKKAAKKARAAKAKKAARAKEAAKAKAKRASKAGKAPAAPRRKVAKKARKAGGGKAAKSSRPSAEKTSAKPPAARTAKGSSGKPSGKKARKPARTATR